MIKSRFCSRFNTLCVPAREAGHKSAFESRLELDRKIAERKQGHHTSGGVQIDTRQSEEENDPGVDLFGNEKLLEFADKSLSLSLLTSSKRKPDRREMVVHHVAKPDLTEAEVLARESATKTHDDTFDAISLSDVDTRQADYDVPEWLTGLVVT